MTWPLQPPFLSRLSIVWILSQPWAKGTCNPFINVWHPRIRKSTSGKKVAVFLFPLSLRNSILIPWVPRSQSAKSAPSWGIRFSKEKDFSRADLKIAKDRHWDLKSRELLSGHWTEPEHSIMTEDLQYATNLTWSPSWLMWWHTLSGHDVIPCHWRSRCTLNSIYKTSCQRTSGKVETRGNYSREVREIESRFWERW